ncbi:SDR family NAD(P)-dependent oxidoreductase [Acidisphaera sp. L21]|uniref:SDR family NAD(P)-dependent oxidoreductase n=1 Tax=Acidisphaera sp. L21 TaxID=1641851 RepID=UPI00131D494C|nr:SDR family oxidoreductase [Acidisphaera sp. L21]
MDMQISGKVALITGGSRGIGRATAAGLVGEGCHVAIAARGQEELDSAAKYLSALGGGRVLTIAADMLDPASPERLVAACMAEYGRLDIVVANAGGSVGARDFATATHDDWAQTFQLNVLHAVDLLRQAIPALAASDAASAIFIASISGRAATTAAASYAAAKAGLIHAARSLAWELGPMGIRVNALSPGSTLFDGGGWDRTKHSKPEAFSEFERMDFPRGRLSTVQEIADAAVFLASPRAMGLNATDLQVDGGQRRPSIR